MQDYVVNRPDEGAMKRILAEEPSAAAVAVLRLAWQAGLLRQEIVDLTWPQLDLRGGSLLLADRVVPLAPELAAWLTALRDSRPRDSGTVVLSDRDRRPLTPQSVSRLARKALDRGGQTAVRLIDLRHDFVLRQLETQDWQVVSRITGIEAAALRAHFAPHLAEGKVSTRAAKAPAPVDEYALWQALQAERGTPAGAALWLAWQLGLGLGEIVSLTWQQIDFETSTLILSGQTLRLPAPAAEALAALPRTGGHVLTAPHGGPYDPARLSRQVRGALVRHGLDNVTLRDLRMDGQARRSAELVACARRESLTRARAAEVLGVPPAEAYRRLRQLVRRGQLTAVGERYYLPSAVVPPERQQEVILEYLAREGFAYRQDIARILGVLPAQCRPILQKLLAEGRIKMERQQYTLNK